MFGDTRHSFCWLDTTTTVLKCRAPTQRFASCGWVVTCLHDLGSACCGHFVMPHTKPRRLAGADAVSLIRLTPSLYSSLRSPSVNAAVVPDHDGQRLRKHSGQRQNGLRHADETVFAQRAPFRRFVPETVLREAILREAAWVDPAATNITPAWECGSVRPTDLAEPSSTSHIARVA